MLQNKSSFGVTVWFLLFLCAVASGADTAPCDPDAVNLVLDGTECELSLANYTYDSVTVRETGRILVRGTVHVVAGSVAVDSGGSIDGTGGGYLHEMGPGPGRNAAGGGGSYSAVGSGGGHGGHGGRGIAIHPAGGGVPYAVGDPRRPSSCGSGGGGTSGGPGGAALHLSVDGVLAVDGVIAMDGAGGPQGGGGAGGSLWVEAQSLTGGGVLRSNGGEGASGSDGRGGGGRVGISVNSTLFSGSMEARTSSGIGQAGSAGTVYLQVESTGVRKLEVNNGGVAGTTPLTFPDRDTSLEFGEAGAEEWTFSTVALGGQDTLQLETPFAILEAVIGSSAASVLSLAGGYARLPSVMQAVTVDTGAGMTVRLDRTANMTDSVLALGAIAALMGGEDGLYLVRSSVVVSSAATASCNGTNDNVFRFRDIFVLEGGVLAFEDTALVLADRVVVASGGRVSTNGGGYGAETGPGAAFDGSGGSHQGIGSGPVPGASYGDAFESRMGSGGGNGRLGGAGGTGGGSLRLVAFEYMVVDGVISADGSPGTSDGGGGAGGTIILEAKNLSGSGMISAAGGQAGDGFYGCGGGGRISVLCVDCSAWNATLFTGSGDEYCSEGASYTEVSDPTSCAGICACDFCGYAPGSCNCYEDVCPGWKVFVSPLGDDTPRTNRGTAASPFKTVQAAIEAATFTPYEVWLYPGVYPVSDHIVPPFDMIVHTVGGYGTVTFDCGGNGPAIKASLGTTIQLNDIIVSGCSAPTGGAVHITDGAVVMQNCSTTNSTGTSGGAFAVVGRNSKLTLMGGAVVANAASDGGAVYAAKGGTVDVDGVSFHSNTALLSGGALYVGRDSVVHVKSTVFDQNSAGNGGGAYSVGSLTIMNVRLTSNSGSDSGGGLSIAGGSLHATDMTVSGNTASGSGGGLSACCSATVSGTNVTVLGNNGALGGGVAASDGAGVDLHAAEMSENTALFGAGAYVSGGTTTVTLDGALVRGGAAVSGGGIYVRDGFLGLTVGVVTDNTATLDGGAVCSFYGTVFASAETVFSRNSASVGAGASIQFGAANFTGAHIVDNTASSNGGGIYFYFTDVLAFSHVNVTGNAAADGAGVCFDKVLISTTSVHACTFHRNTAARFGGGIYMADSLALTVEATSVFSSNRALSGAGLFVTVSVEGHNVTLEGSRFEFNSASHDGGGALVDAVMSTAVHFISCSFSGNSCGGAGGGAALRTPFVGTVAVDVVASAFSANSAHSGGGLHFDGAAATVTAATTSFAGNTAVRGGGAYWSASGVLGLEGSAFSSNAALAYGPDQASAPTTATWVTPPPALVYSGEVLPTLEIEMQDDFGNAVRRLEAESGAVLSVVVAEVVPATAVVQLQGTSVTAMVDTEGVASFPGLSLAASLPFVGVSVVLEPVGALASVSEAAVSVAFVACPAGTHEVGLGLFAVCQLTCEAGWELTAYGECVPCQPGWARWDTARCAKCRKGSATSTPGTRICDACPAGMYARQEGLLFCETCPAMHFSRTGAEVCEPCAEGEWSHGNSSKCSFCPPGTYRDGFLTNCTACPAGSVSAARAAACTLCPDGEFTQDGRTCLDCEAGTYRDSLTANCTRCPVGSVSRRRARACTPCSLEEYTEDGETCLDCPEGASCNNALRTPEALPGWWMAAAQTGQTQLAGAFAKCPNPAACEDGHCTEAYTGTLCGDCVRAPVKHGFAVQYACSKCPEDWVSVLITLVIVALFVGIVAWLVLSSYKKTDKPTLDQSLIKILLNHIHMVALAYEFSANARALSSRYWSVQSVVAGAGSMTSLFSVSCLFDYSQYDLVVVSIVLPPVLVLCGACTWGLVALRHTGCTKRRAAEETDEDEQSRDLSSDAVDGVHTLKHYWKRTVSTAVIVLFTVYPSVVKELAKVFPCRSDVVPPVVVADVSLECFDGAFYQYAVAAAIFLLLYGVGIPAVAVSLLRRNVAHFDDINVIHQYGFMYRGYRIDAWWWEGVVLLRKLSTIMILVAVTHPSMQVACGIVLATFSALLQRTMRPWDSSRLNHIELASLVVVDLSLIFSIVYLSDGIVDGDALSDEVLDVVTLGMLLMNLFIILLVIGTAVWSKCKSWRKKKFANANEKEKSNSFADVWYSEESCESEDASTRNDFLPTAGYSEMMAYSSSAEGVEMAEHSESLAPIDVGSDMGPKSEDNVARGVLPTAENSELSSEANSSSGALAV